VGGAIRASLDVDMYPLAMVKDSLLCLLSPAVAAVFNNIPDDHAPVLAGTRQWPDIEPGYCWSPQ
jgi:hypothetical protein